MSQDQYDRYDRYDGIPTEDGRYGPPSERQEPYAPPAHPQDDPFRRTGPVPGPSRPQVRKPDLKGLVERARRVEPEQAVGYRQWRRQ